VVIGGLDQVGPDIVQRHVHLRRQPGLVQEHGAGRVDHGLAAEDRPHPARELVHQQLVRGTVDPVVDGLRRGTGQRA
jgi:hypothetical protein